MHNLEYDENLNEDFEDDWKTGCWWKNKCSLLKARDKHSTISLEREDGVLVGCASPRRTPASTSC